MSGGRVIDFYFSVQVDSEYIPDISAESPLCVSGKYRGKFPDTVIAKGNLADMTEISIELKVQHVTDMPLDNVRCPNLLLYTFVLGVATFTIHLWICQRLYLILSGIFKPQAKWYQMLRTIQLS
jgi:hypothetical protein